MSKIVNSDVSKKKMFYTTMELESVYHELFPTTEKHQNLLGKWWSKVVKALLNKDNNLNIWENLSQELLCHLTWNLSYTPPAGDLRVSPFTNNSRGNSQVSQKEIQEISSAFTGCKKNGQRSTLFILELKPMPSADGSSGNLDYKRAGRELEVYLCI